MVRQPVSTASSYYALQPHQHYHDPALASLAYRPLQLPLQQHAAAEQQLSLAAASGFHQTDYRQHHGLPLRITRQQTRQARAMASFQQQSTTDEEVAELQKLSNEYEPEVTVCFRHVTLGDDFKVPAPEIISSADNTSAHRDRLWVNANRARLSQRSMRLRIPSSKRRLR